MELPGLKSFLVPVDGGEASRRAKRYAVALAKQCGATVVLFHAHGPISGRIGPDGRERIIRKDMENISKVFSIYEEGCKEAGIVFKKVVGHGPAVESIIDAARSYNCDMIIMGSKHHAPRKVLGSVTDAVSAHSSVPVVVVGGECDCSNSCGSSCVRKWRFAPMPNLQNDAVAC
jgi:nucleotide-binding universal stress UspA family protein